MTVDIFCAVRYAAKNKETHKGLKEKKISQPKMLTSFMNIFHENFIVIPRKKKLLCMTRNAMSYLFLRRY